MLFAADVRRSDIGEMRHGEGEVGMKDAEWIDGIGFFVCCSCVCVCLLGVEFIQGDV